MVPFHSFLVGVPCLSWVPLCFIDTVQLLFCPAVILDPTNYTLGSDFIVSLLWSHPFLVEWYHSVLVVHFIFSFFSMFFGTNILSVTVSYLGSHLIISYLGSHAVLLGSILFE